MNLQKKTMSLGFAIALQNKIKKLKQLVVQHKLIMLTIQSVLGLKSFFYGCLHAFGSSSLLLKVTFSLFVSDISAEIGYLLTC